MQNQLMARAIIGVMLLPAASAIAADDDVKSSAVAEQFQQLVEQAEQEGRSRELASKFIALADKNPKHPIAVEALVWVVANMRRGAEASQAIATLSAHHIKSHKIGTICERLVRQPHRDAERLLRLSTKKSPHKAVQARACFYLAAHLKEQLRLSSSLKNAAGQKRRFEQFYGKDFTKHLEGLNEETVNAEIEGLYERITKSFADVEIDDGTMGQTANKELFALRHLSVGRRAPEISGEDIDGTSFRLSDYLGKIVVLDFWGDW